MPLPFGLSSPKPFDKLRANGSFCAIDRLLVSRQTDQHANNPYDLCIKDAPEQ
jgi:hypothetical protein